MFLWSKNKRFNLAYAFQQSENIIKWGLIYRHIICSSIVFDLFVTRTNNTFLVKRSVAQTPIHFHQGCGNHIRLLKLPSNSTFFLVPWISKYFNYILIFLNLYIIFPMLSLHMVVITLMSSIGTKLKYKLSTFR